MELNAGGLSTLVIGREEEIETLKTYIKFSQHTVISAPRRYGKTTLANRVLDELKNDYLIVKVDMFEATNVKELCEIYLNAIYNSVGIKNFLHKAKESIFSLLDKFHLTYEVEGIKIGYEISKEQDTNRLIEKTFNFANQFASLSDKKMIVFIDEFGEVEKFGQDFIKKIRSYMQRHKNIIYLFAGSQTSVINSIFLNKENAFFNFATLMNISMLKEKATLQFLQDIDIDGKSFTKKAINTIHRTTKFHPFYMIKTVQEAYIKALLQKSPNIETIHVHDAINKILDDNNAYFESIWQKINHKKYKGSIFKSFYANRKSLNSSEISSSYKSQLITELKQEGFLTNKLKLTDPFLSLWIANEG